MTGTSIMTAVAAGLSRGVKVGGPMLRLHLITAVAGGAEPWLNTRIGVFRPGFGREWHTTSPT